MSTNQRASVLSYLMYHLILLQAVGTQSNKALPVLQCPNPGPKDEPEKSLNVVQSLQLGWILSNKTLQTNHP